MAKNKQKQFLDEKPPEEASAEKPASKQSANRKLYNWFVYSIVTLFLSPFIAVPILLFVQLPVAIAITFVIFIISFLAIWLIPPRLIREIKNKKSGETQSEFDRERDYLKLLDDTRKTTAQVLGGLFFVISLGVAFYTYDLTKQRLLTERYSEAVKLLKIDNDPFIRTAGLYELQSLSEESDILDRAIMDVSILYITNRSAKITDKDCNFNPGENNRDILIASKIIGNTVSINARQDFLIDLRGDNSNNTKICRANFNGAKLRDTNFDNAAFDNGCFVKVDFTNADLENTRFNGARLTDAVFTDANIKGADFSGSNLSKDQINAATLDDSTVVPPELETAKKQRIDFLKEIKRQIQPNPYIKPNPYKTPKNLFWYLFS